MHIPFTSSPVALAACDWPCARFERRLNHCAFDVRSYVFSESNFVENGNLQATIVRWDFKAIELSIISRTYS